VRENPRDSVLTHSHASKLASERSTPLDHRRVLFISIFRNIEHFSWESGFFPNSGKSISESIDNKTGLTNQSIIPTGWLDIDRISKMSKILGGNLKFIELLESSAETIIEQPASAQSSPDIKQCLRYNTKPFCTCHSSGNLVDGLPLAVHTHSIYFDFSKMLNIFGESLEFPEILEKITSEPIKNGPGPTKRSNYRQDSIRLYESLLDVSLERKPGWRFTARHTLLISSSLTLNQVQLSHVTHYRH